MNEWERMEKERKLREQAEATGAFINMILDELIEAKKYIGFLLGVVHIKNTYNKEIEEEIAKAEAFLKE